MASIISSDLTSALATSQLQVPTEIAEASDFKSTQNNAPIDAPSTTLEDYKGVDWKRLKGYSVPTDDTVIDSQIWKLGWRLYKEQSERYYWLCKQCHRAKRCKKNSFEEALYVADRATSGAISHLRTTHNVNQYGKSTSKKRKRPIEEVLMDGFDEVSAVANQAAAAYNLYRFKALFYDWLIHDNVSFEQLNSLRFQELLQYLQPRCRNHLPSPQTASRTVESLYDKSLGTVTEILQSAITRINISFDLWTSKNSLALLGLCAHFIDNTGKPITSLLALPRQYGKHSGYNISESVNQIIAFYSIGDKLGYFTTDNAFSNATCLRYIAEEYGFDVNSRWVRCSGHIFNLVGQAALFGSDSEAFASALNDITTEELELRQWRKKGPIGKLHNIVYWVNRSPQRCERLDQLQQKLIAPLKPEGKKDIYQLIKDVETRWNSFYYSAERATYLRVAIDELLEEEHTQYERYAHHCRSAGRNITNPRPPILDDTLTNDDWTVITRYVQILKPLKDATLALEGNIGGRFGAIWRLLPQYEKVLQHFEDLVTQYPVNDTMTPLESPLPPPPAFDTSVTSVTEHLSTLLDNTLSAEHHFSINIKLAWKKMNDYYTKLDNNPIYIAAVVLHPRMKWQWLERAWKERPDWIKAAKGSFNQLVIEYEYKATSEPATSEPPPAPATTSSKRVRRLYDDSSDDDDLFDDDSEAALTIHQQLVDYLRERQQGLKQRDSPITYWLMKRKMWPHLAAMALDIYSAAAMSDEPERVFSITGAAITPRRRLLKSDKIQHLMCLKAWLHSGVISLDQLVPLFTSKTTSLLSKAVETPLTAWQVPQPPPPPPPTPQNQRQHVMKSYQTMRKNWSSCIRNNTFTKMVLALV